jgi:hypothetical protein
MPIFAIFISISYKNKRLPGRRISFLERSGEETEEQRNIQLRNWIFDVSLFFRFLFLHHFRSTHPIVQGFSQKRDKEEINNGYTGKAAEEYAPDGGSSPLFVHHFGIAEPFGRCSLENNLKKTIVDKHHPEKYPPEIKIRVSPIPYLKHPKLIKCKCQDEDDQGVDKEIQYSGAFAYFSHTAKLVSSE